MRVCVYDAYLDVPHVDVALVVAAPHGPFHLAFSGLYQQQALCVVCVAMMFVRHICEATPDPIGTS